MEEDDVQSQISHVKKGRVALAQALHKLDLVSASFTRLQDLEKSVNSQESAITEMKGLMKYFVSVTGLRAAFDQFMKEVQDSVSVKLSRFKEHIETQLEDRPTQEVLVQGLSGKAGSVIVTGLQEQVQSLRSQFETLSSSVFESFKTEVKRSLATKLDAGMASDAVTEVTRSEVWKSLQKRMDASDQMVQELRLQLQRSPTSSNARMHIETSEAVPIDLASSLHSVLSPKSPQSSTNLGDLTKVVGQTQQEVISLYEEIGNIKELVQSKFEALKTEAQGMKSVLSDVETLSRRIGNNELSDSVKVRKRPEDERVVSLDFVQKQHDSSLKRIVKIETDISTLLSTTEFLKSRQKDKLNEYVKSIHYLNSQREIQTRELEALKQQLADFEKKQTKALISLKEELLVVRGPMVDMLQTQARESGALNTEIKRHQELFRSFVTDYTSAMGAINPISGSASFRTSGPTSSQRIEFQDRVHSASPGLRLRKRLRQAGTPGKEGRDARTPVNGGKGSAQERNFSASMRSTPRKLLDFDKSSALP